VITIKVSNVEGLWTWTSVHITSEGLFVGVQQQRADYCGLFASLLTQIMLPDLKLRPRCCLLFSDESQVDMGKEGRTKITSSLLNVSLSMHLTLGKITKDGQPASFVTTRVNQLENLHPSKCHKTEIQLDLERQSSSHGQQGVLLHLEILGRLQAEAPTICPRLDWLFCQTTA
jgi:hypothetical protein